MSEATLVPSEKIGSWEDFEKISAELINTPFPNTWGFRGQSDLKYSLEPSILRVLKKSNFDRRVCNLLEKESVRNFKAQAHLHIQEYLCQSCEDDADWWAIMQHHGAPTRLLDWTNSPYVAAYFACIGDLEKPGAVWAFSQAAVAEYNRDVLGLKFELQGLDLSKMCEDESIPDILMSIERKTRTQRMVSQQGFFTFCSNILTDHQEHLAKFFVQPGKLVGFMKYEIPSELKIEFLRKLHFMNITASSLFHGIDGLGKSIDEKLKIQVADSLKVQKILVDHMRRNQSTQPNEPKQNT